MENVHAENNLDIEIPFYYFNNYQNLDNHQLESSNIIPDQFIIYLKEDKEEHQKEKSKSIDPLEFYNSELKNTETELLYVYDHVSKGFAIKISANKKDKVLEQLKNNPLVEYIGQDKKITAFIDTKHLPQLLQTNNKQQILPISIDRVKDDADDNDDLSLVAGRGLGGESPLSIDADIAILDTGIDLDHSDLRAYPKIILL